MILSSLMEEGSLTRKTRYKINGTQEVVDLFIMCPDLQLFVSGHCMLNVLLKGESLLKLTIPHSTCYDIMDTHISYGSH